MMINFIDFLATLNILYFLAGIIRYVWQAFLLVANGIGCAATAVIFPPKQQSIEAEDANPLIYYDPIFSCHLIIYRTLDVKTARLPPWKRNAFLSGRRFASIADSIIEGTMPVALERLGVTFSPAIYQRLEDLMHLPVLRVTTPENGDRKPEPGERGAKKGRVVRSLLRVPKKKSKAGKEKRLEDERAGQTQADEE